MFRARRLAAALLALLPLLVACTSTSLSTSGRSIVAGTPSGATAAPPADTAASATVTSRDTATPSPVAASYPQTMQGSDGHTITLTRPPQRIVSLAAGYTEILFAIGADGQVVAVDRFSDYPEATRSLPKLEYTNPSLEALAALQPDLVLLGARQRSSAATFEQAGLRVLLLNEPDSVAGVLDRVRQISRLTGHAVEGEALVRSMQSRIDAVVRAVQGASSHPKVYHELDANLFSAAPNSFVGDLYTLLNARNIAPAGPNPYPRLTNEAIIAANPDVIVLADGTQPGSTPDDVKRRPGWDAIAAVRTGRIYVIDPNIVSRPGPRIIDALEMLARDLYPDRFH
jgi:iron complex transport system substrate-binding protein